MSGTLHEHLSYVADSLRNEHFRSAINKVVKPGDHVFDLGCGTGILGLFCLQAGASKVHAIDSTIAIEVARESLSRAGWLEKASLVRGSSYQVELPDRVDVVICDHVGFFGFDYGLIELLSDARSRFLKPDGKLIPGRIKLQLGAVESGQCWELANSWLQPCIPPEFHWLRQHGVNAKYAVNLQPAEVISEPVELACIDLAEDHPDFFSWSSKLTVSRDGVLHGLAGWFDCELAEGVWMTNSPLADDAISRAQAFLPIDEALELTAGDVLGVTVSTRPADNLIAWEVRHLPTGKTFRHSTWQGELQAQGQLARSSPAHVPTLNSSARAKQKVLALCDGKRSISQIQDAVLREHPDLFPSSSEVNRFVASVLGSNTE